MEIKVPFAELVGLRTRGQHPGDTAILLPDARSTTNHIGTQHAGALFTVAETASGAAVQACFAGRVAPGAVLPVVRNASIQFKRAARGEISATGVVKGDPDSIVEALRSEGRTQFDVQVSLQDAQNEEVASCVVQWHLKAIPPAPAE